MSFREELLKTGRNDTSTNARVQGGLSARSPRAQHKKLETETNSISANLIQNRKSNFDTQRRGNIKQDIDFQSSDETLKGVKNTNKVSSENEISLVNSNSSKEFGNENKQNKQTNKQGVDISKSEFQCDHDESAFDGSARNGTETETDSSHSRLNRGSQGVELGSGQGAEGTRGVASEIGGVVGGKGKRRGVNKKVTCGTSSGEDTESDSDDGVAERDELAKKGFGKKSEVRRGMVGSEKEGTISRDEDTLIYVSTPDGTDTNISIGVGGSGKDRTISETGGKDDGELESVWKRENESETNSNSLYDRNTEGLQSGPITVGGLFKGGLRRQRGDTKNEDFDWSDPLCGSLDAGAHSIGQVGRPATTGRKAHVGQSETASQLLNNLLSAKRPSSAYPGGSSYSFTLTQPYTFSYYKS